MTLHYPTNQREHVQTIGLSLHRQLGNSTLHFGKGTGGAGYAGRTWVASAPQEAQGPLHYIPTRDPQLGQNTAVPGIWKPQLGQPFTEGAAVAAGGALLDTTGGGLLAGGSWVIGIDCDCARTPGAGAGSI